MKVLAIEENFVLNITQIYEYRLSMAQIERFYDNRVAVGGSLSQDELDNAQANRQMLTQLFTDKVENINKENQIVDYKKEEI